MDAPDIKAKWLELTGEAKRRWGKLTDDDLAVIDGDIDKLKGKLRERYDLSDVDAEAEVNAWISRL
jgi:uncharacterized protein YjbJ (UPF0337 family)